MVQRVNADRHAPNRFHSYCETHETVLEQYKTMRFVGSDNLEFNRYTDKNTGNFKISLNGKISCLGPIVITVEKILKIVDWYGKDEPVVETLCYAYNVSVSGHGNIFRYDNQDDDYLRDGHEDAHHKHSFRWISNKEDPNSPIWTGKDNWPTLGQVIQEAHDWYCDNSGTLPNPSSYAEIDW
jgi:hypothetical protein